VTKGRNSQFTEDFNGEADGGSRGVDNHNHNHNYKSMAYIPQEAA
jgi:hypothetical protein